MRNIKYFKHGIWSILLATTISISSALAQDEAEKNEAAPEGWHHLDRVLNAYNGVSTEKAYEILKGKESRTVVVAVIDSGVDIDHEDLAGNIWVNEDELPGNGVDDDKNGYIDDVHGWNFIGEVEEDTYELTRLYVKYSKKFQDKTEEQVAKAEREDWDYFQKLKKDLEKQISENRQQLNMVSQFYSMYQKSERLISAYLDTEMVTKEDLDALESPDQKVTGARDLMNYALDNGFDANEIEDYIDNLETILNYGYNPTFDPREKVGDNFDDPYEKGYGDSNVKGGSHGTQVAGVIAAKRGNGIGIDGIADNVKIMAIKAVPDGDERDKDVANAIIYAVDNGAHIVNMSFGKSYSPRKDVVDAAVKYAESKGVLLIHAAGNSHKDIDVRDNFPTRKYTGTKKEASNWIEVGASSWGDEDNFVAGFSNYGKKTVDLFAPGVAIYTTSPKNEYNAVDGTSFASPVTSGVAALIMSYYPELSAKEVRDVLLSSAVKFDNLQVNQPADFDEEVQMVDFTELSITGGIVNAYEAVKLAESMKVGNKK